MTKFRKHHPRACYQRQTLPKEIGGRGIIDIQNLHYSQINLIRTYFNKKKEHSSLHNAIILADEKYTPLHLNKSSLPISETTIQNKIDTWKQKTLHGRHYDDLNNSIVDKIASNTWLKRGELFPETEGFMIAIQDQIIYTRNYRKYIIKDPNLF